MKVILPDNLTEIPDTVHKMNRQALLAVEMQQGYDDNFALEIITFHAADNVIKVSLQHKNTMVAAVTFCAVNDTRILLRWLRVTIAEKFDCQIPEMLFDPKTDG